MAFVDSAKMPQSCIEHRPDKLSLEEEKELTNNFEFRSLYSNQFGFKAP